jgi:hypothetical protein
LKARRACFLIDEADKLNDASANALLKVLEEPPQNVAPDLDHGASGECFCRRSFRAVR